MNFIAAVLAIIAIVLFILEASWNRSRPAAAPWKLGWIGFALLTTALLIWHTVGGLDPVLNP